MNKKIITSTWCTDDGQKTVGIDPLEKSFKKFHPDVHFDIIGTERTQKTIEKYSYIDECMTNENVPWFIRGKTELFLTAPLVYDLKEKCDMIVHIDADSVVLGDLSEIFSSDEDVISVKNTSPLGTWGMNPGSDRVHPYTGQVVGNHEFVNMGMWALNNFDFIDDWIEYNKAILTNPNVPIPYRLTDGLGDENDTFSWLFHSGKYSNKIIDRHPCESGYYGCSVSWGEKSNWDTWKSFYIKNEKVYFMDPICEKEVQVKLLHLAGGGGKEKANVPFMDRLRENLSSEVYEFVEAIVND